jgi:hypothetical protein
MNICFLLFFNFISFQLFEFIQQPGQVFLISYIWTSLTLHLNPIFESFFSITIQLIFIQILNSVLSINKFTWFSTKMYLFIKNIIFIIIINVFKSHIPFIENELMTSKCLLPIFLLSLFCFLHLFPDDAFADLKSLLTSPEDKLELFHYQTNRISDP